MKKMLLLVLGLTVSAGCSSTSHQPLAPEAKQAIATDSIAIIRPPASLTALAYPAWYKELPVPWATQFIPGSNAATKNCGQACAAMIDGYYKRYQPTANTIIGVDRWLDRLFPGLGYATPNSYYTHVLGPRYALTRVLRDYFHYSTYYVQGATTDNLSRIFRCLNAGFPVIVCVEVSGGEIVPWDAVDHWIVLVGFNQDRGGEVIFHNPGTAHTSKGKFRHMPVGDFLKSWSYGGGFWVPVTYPVCAYF